MQLWLLSHEAQDSWGKNALLHPESPLLLILTHSQKVHFESLSLWKNISFLEPP